MREACPIKPSFWNSSDNTKVLEILTTLKYKPRLADAYLAAEHGSVNIMNYLLEEGSINPQDIDEEENYSLLIVAIKNNREEIVKLLLADSRVDPTENVPEYSILIACPIVGAASIPNHEILTLLVADGRQNLNWSVPIALGVVKKDDHKTRELLLTAYYKLALVSGQELFLG